MHYLRSTSDSLGLKAEGIETSSILRYLTICVFCCHTSYKSRNFSDGYQIIFFTDSSSFSCEKTIMKVSGPVNELF